MKILAIILLSIFLLACGNSTVSNNSTTANVNKTPTDPATVIDRANPLGNPKSSIAYQFELVKAGDQAKLMECFTEKAQKKLTPPIVESAKANAAKITFDDIVAKIEEEENSNGKFAHIRMKDNRPLVILVLKDGKWLSDQVWFR
jgi:hypothetical protein